MTEELPSCESSRPKNVPARLWEKFKALEKRTNETTKRSTEKRIKHLQKTALDNVARALCHPEDREIVQIPGDEDPKSGAASVSSSVSASVTVSRKRPLESDTKAVQNEARDSDATERGTGEEKEWSQVRGLMGVNEHLAGVSHGSLGPKTVLEVKVEEAIAVGDYKTAEELSDRMAAREFGEKVTKALDAKSFLEHKQKEEETAKAKRKKKLHWGFEAKHRWETKSNM